MAVRLRHIAVRLLFALVDCAPVIADLLVVNLKLLLSWLDFLFWLLLVRRFRGIDLNFDLVLVEIGFIVLDLVLDPALHILKVVWLQRRGDCSLPLQRWLLSLGINMDRRLSLVGLLYRRVLDKAVAALLDSVLSDAFVFFVVNCA